MDNLLLLEVVNFYHEPQLETLVLGVALMGRRAMESQHQPFDKKLVAFLGLLNGDGGAYTCTCGLRLRDLHESGSRVQTTTRTASAAAARDWKSQSPYLHFEFGKTGQEMTREDRTRDVAVRSEEGRMLERCGTIGRRRRVPDEFVHLPRSQRTESGTGTYSGIRTPIRIKGEEEGVDGKLRARKSVCTLTSVSHNPQSTPTAPHQHPQRPRYPIVPEHIRPRAHPGPRPRVSPSRVYLPFRMYLPVAVAVSPSMRMHIRRHAHAHAEQLPLLREDERTGVGGVEGGAGAAAGGVAVAEAFAAGAGAGAGSEEEEEEEGSAAGVGLALFLFLFLFLDFLDFLESNLDLDLDLDLDADSDSDSAPDSDLGLGARGVRMRRMRRHTAGVGDRTRSKRAMISPTWGWRQQPQRRRAPVPFHFPAPTPHHGKRQLLMQLKRKLLPQREERALGVQHAPAAKRAEDARGVGGAPERLAHELPAEALVQGGRGELAGEDLPGEAVGEQEVVPGAEGLLHLPRADLPFGRGERGVAHEGAVVVGGLDEGGVLGGGDDAEAQARGEGAEGGRLVVVQERPEFVGEGDPRRPVPERCLRVDFVKVHPEPASVGLVVDQILRPQFFGIQSRQVRPALRPA
ncbi:hypothetical protein B0H11DRAFT_2361371 [Mycena galericulata]|nr:hypothetical protein B0H11DRAFT_2361371 [Mycena galericulata]